MSSEIVPISNGKLSRAVLEKIPAQIVRAGDKAVWRFIEFFAANIRNKNTRFAYAHAVTQFFDWCDRKHIELPQLRPAVIALYIEQHPAAAPTVKQHLAAIRMLFDWMVIGQIVPMNPVAEVNAGYGHALARDVWYAPAVVGKSVALVYPVM